MNAGGRSNGSGTCCVRPTTDRTNEGSTRPSTCVPTTRASVCRRACRPEEPRTPPGLRPGRDDVGGGGELQSTVRDLLVERSADGGQQPVVELLVVRFAEGPTH